MYRANSGTLYHPVSGLCVEPAEQVESGDPSVGAVQLALCDGQQKQVRASSNELALYWNSPCPIVVGVVKFAAGAHGNDVAVRCALPHDRHWGFEAV